MLDFGEVIASGQPAGRSGPTARVQQAYLGYADADDHTQEIRR